MIKALVTTNSLLKGLARHNPDSRRRVTMWTRFDFIFFFLALSKKKTPRETKMTKLLTFDKVLPPLYDMNDASYHVFSPK